MKVKVNKASATTSTYKNVELSEPTVGDMITAERVAGGNEGIKYMLALLAQVGVFDGKKRVAEDLEGLSLTDFFAISQALMAGGLKDLAGQLSSAVKKEG